MGGAVTKESLFEDEESPHERADFRDYPRLPDEQAENILAMTDDSERARKTAEYAQLY